MAYKFFDKKFLVMPDDEDIIGKQCIFANTLPSLIDKVESANIDMNLETGVAIENVEQFPFVASATEYRLCYYDPNYECKVAYSQGKQIQFKSFGGNWVDVADKPLWSERNVYRVKPDTWYVHPFFDKDGNCIGHPFYIDMNNKTFVAFEGTKEACDKWIEERTPKTRRMTNRELARWLADNKGQYAFSCASVFYTSYSYCGGEDTAEVADTVRIRAWDETEWHEPLVEVKE